LTTICHSGLFVAATSFPFDCDAAQEKRISRNDVPQEFAVEIFRRSAVLNAEKIAENAACHVFATKSATR